MQQIFNREGDRREMGRSDELVHWCGYRLVLFIKNNKKDFNNNHIPQFGVVWLVFFFREGVVWRVYCG